MKQSITQVRQKNHTHNFTSSWRGANRSGRLDIVTFKWNRFPLWKTILCNFLWVWCFSFKIEQKKKNVKKIDRVTVTNTSMSVSLYFASFCCLSCSLSILMNKSRRKIKNALSWISFFFSVVAAVRYLLLFYFLDEKHYYVDV